MPDIIYWLGGLVFFAVTYYFSCKDMNKEEDYTVKDNLDKDDYEVK